jgi:hypothetical protein
MGPKYRAPALKPTVGREKIWGQNMGPKYGAKIWGQNMGPKYGGFTPYGV